MQGAAVGALAFTVGGVEVLLLPSEARAQNVPLKVLTADEARRLEAVSETLVPGAREAGIAHFVDQQCSVPPHEALLSIRIGNVRPPFVNFFRAALTEIDRQCNTKHGKPFAELTADEQRDFIASCAWASTRTGKARRHSRRSTAASAPTPSTSSTARWKAPSASACPTWRSFLQRRGGDMATQEKVDVAIVGAGPSGSVFADVLARAGKKVVVLEFGPDWDYKQFVSSEIWGKRLKHAPRFQLAGRHNPGHGSNAGWGTGGAMIHFFANWPRLHPNDFKVKSQYGKGLDWPISYDDLLPYYDRIAEDVGISGDAAAEKRWYPVGKNYPMPPLKTFRQGDIFNDAFKAHGIPLAPMPVAINSTPYKDRPACVNCGWCHVGCAIGAAASPLVNHLRDARKNGAEVRPFSYVTRVLTNGSGDRVTGVEYYDAQARAARAAGGDRGARCLCGRDPAHHVQLEDRQAPEGPVEPQRAGRQVPDVPQRCKRLGAVRRGRPELHGHGRQPVHVVRDLRQAVAQEGLRQHLPADRRGDEAECRPRGQRGPICSGRRSPTS